MTLSSIKECLIELLQNKNATIGIIGLGYVGLPLALAYCEQGYKVIGFDKDKKKKDSIELGQSYLKHISSERIKKAVEAGLLSVFTGFDMSAKCDAIIICVPTPLGKHNDPDLSYILESLRSVLPYLRQGQIISLESTTYPGTTEEIIKPLVESTGLSIGSDAYLVFSPEREDPGNPIFHTTNIPKVMGGCTFNCSDVGHALYSSIVCDVIRVSSPRVAEMTKLLENIHRAVNIGLVNEMKVVADAMHIDIFEVIDAAGTKPFGFVSYKPGPGLGGHCIPIDPFYLTWKAKEYGVASKFIELAGEINSSMPEYVVKKVGLALNSVEKSFKNSNILVVGLSYKKNVDDCRESPAITVINSLLDLSASVSCYDPFFNDLPASRKWGMVSPIFIKSLGSEMLESFDACILVTDHDCLDYQLIARHSSLIIDTRGRFSKAVNVIRA
jgi:UDP-N-acetyl-D-glucosamine dehydrogenase